jgi:aminotransferase
MLEISKKAKRFTESVIREMTRLCNQHGGVNLAQGFPDFPAPQLLKSEAMKAVDDDVNQYAITWGAPGLRQAIASKTARTHPGWTPDPDTEITVTCGATEAMIAAMLGLLDPGDEVVLFEPFYDSYPACVAFAGATPRFCTLRFPAFELREEDLRPLFNEKTKLIVLNSPHNPSGRVFSRAELEVVAKLCREHDVVALTDEVYEHITYDGARPIPLATLPGMRERTLTLSSAGKTFSLTGWKIGWGVGPRPLVSAAQAAHQFVTFSVATPLQVAMAAALTELREEYFTQLRREYAERRDFLMEVLARAGFELSTPQGAYFVLADTTKIFPPAKFGDDREVAKRLVQEHGVATIPPSVFYRRAPEEGRRLLRFAFCKKMETLQRAAERIARIGAGGAA